MCIIALLCINLHVPAVVHVCIPPLDAVQGGSAAYMAKYDSYVIQQTDTPGFNCLHTECIYMNVYTNSVTYNGVDVLVKAWNVSTCDPALSVVPVENCSEEFHHPS